MVSLVRTRDDMDRDVAGVGIVAQQVEQHEAVDVGQAEIEGDRVGAKLADQPDGARPGRGNGRVSKRHPGVPNVPTLSEAGFDITMSKGAGWSVLVPKGTPAPIVGRLSEALRKVLGQTDVQEALVRANSLAAWQTAQEYKAGVEADRRMYSELLPAIKVKGN